MRTLATLATILLTATLWSQHPNDLCEQAESMYIYPTCDFRWFSTLTAQNDIYDNNMTMNIGIGMNLTLGTEGNDIWFTWVKSDINQPLTVDIYGGECIAPNLIIANYGEFQGWTFSMWWGPTCATALPVYGTNHAHLTDQWPAIVLDYDGYGTDEDGIPQPLNNTGYYDPTRQVWRIEFSDIPTGRYFGRISGLGWCRGEAWLRVCEGYQVLGIEFPVQELDTFTIHEQEPKMNKRYDTAGRRVE